MPSLGSEITVISEDQNTDIIVTLSDADGEFFANAAAGYADKALQYKNTVEALTSRAQTSADTATARANEARASAQNAVTAAEGASNSEFTAGEYANSALEYMQSASNSRNSAALSASQARGYATNAQQAYENTIALNAVVGIEESVVESGGLNPYTGERLTVTKANGSTVDIDLLVKLYNDIGSSVTGAMTQRAVTNLLELKQDKLTAGANITIDANNVISATGGGGGGAVNSVNGQTGNVVLDADDVGALPDTTTASDLGAYVKPTNGIPKTDLASAVQTSLGKADTALQTAPVTSVNTKTGAVTLTASDVGALSSSTTYVSSVNGSSGAVTIGNATTSSAGLMSATDKANLDAVVADYSSALVALNGE